MSGSAAQTFRAALDENHDRRAGVVAPATGACPARIARWHRPPVGVAPDAVLPFHIDADRPRARFADVADAGLRAFEPG